MIFAIKLYKLVFVINFLGLIDMKTLHNPIRDTGDSYCGSSAISAITKLPCSSIEKIVRKITDRKNRIRGLLPVELQWILEYIGVSTKFSNFGKDCPTLNQFVRDRETNNKIYIVWTSTHYLVVHNGKVVDNHETLTHIDNRRRFKKAKIVGYLEIKDD